MTRKRHMEAQIIAVVKHAQAGMWVQELCRQHGISDPTFDTWRAKDAGLELSAVKQLRQLEKEHRRLKQLVDEYARDIQAVKALTAKKLIRSKAKRTAATLLVARLGLSERRGCRVVTRDWNTPRYRSRRSDDGELRMRMREIAETKRRYGCPRIYVRLRREGWRVKHKKVEWLFWDEGLSLRRRARKSYGRPSRPLPTPTRPGLCYAMDFVHDRLAKGRRFTCFTMTDPCSKEVPVIEVDVSIGGERVCRILGRLFLGRPWPEIVIMDNGPEFSGTALDMWAWQHGCKQ